MKTELETLNWIRKLMKPLPQSVDKSKLWLAGSYRNHEEFILINLRQKVLNRINKLENKKEDIPFEVKLEKVLMEANQLGLNEVNLEFNPKKLKRLAKVVE